MKKAAFQSCFPKGSTYEKVVLLTRLYMVAPLAYDMELILEKGEKKTTCLGHEEWAGLGVNTWIFSGEDRWESRSIVFPNQ